MPRRPRRAELRDEFGDVAHARRERAAPARAHAGSSASSSPYSFIDDPQPAALTATRSTPAARRPRWLCRAKRAASSSRPACSGSAPQQPCVSWRQRPSQPSADEHVDGGALTLREDQPLHAAGQQTDRQPALAAGVRVHGSASRTATTRRIAGRERQRGAEAIAQGDGQRSSSSFAVRRSPFGVRCSSSDPSHAAGQRRKCEAQPADRASSAKRRGGNRRSAERPRDSAARSARASLDERRVLHAGRTRRDARHAAQAGVEVAHERRRHRRAPFEAGFHQIDAPARRIHLLAPQHVGRAGRQAEAAVHARVDERRIGRLIRGRM